MQTDGVGADNALGVFLLSRRARLLPAQVGLPTHGTRRTTGLRREEAAALSGVSIDYYTRLEQGRDRHPSYEVLAAISRGLRLTADEHRHLCHLAGLAIPEPAVDARAVRPRIREILDALDPMPAYLLTPALDVIAWNRTATLVLTDFAAVPKGDRNIVWLNFLHPPLRQRWSDWGDTAKDLVGNLRAELGRHPGEPRILAVAERMAATSPEFADLWDRQDVAQRCGAMKLLAHPEVGTLRMVCETMRVPPADQRLVTFHAADEATARRLDALGRTPSRPHDATPARLSALPRPTAHAVRPPRAVGGSHVSMPAPSDGIR
ncbi:helix-turn-helix transcriptional regulator [Frankia sp. Cas3]|uniref:helix-turn-helix transcriptional regulator n=1 Tax=Frankia sp. Cas3 TaxID=3073926 RepID=UPI002AD47E34|nr:helix-turn-helix transcriptional regulator [Frankia sp. Cas3]